MKIQWRRRAHCGLGGNPFEVNRIARPPAMLVAYILGFRSVRCAHGRCTPGYENPLLRSFPYADTRYPLPGSKRRGGGLGDNPFEVNRRPRPPAMLGFILGFRSVRCAHGRCTPGYDNPLLRSSLTPYAYRLMSRVSCLMSHVSCLMSHAYRLMSRVSCLMSHVSCLMPHA